MARLGNADLDVSRLCLGGNVFSWTVSPSDSPAILDAFAEAGGNFIDTADSYTYWAEGNSGGGSETIIGEWIKARGNRDRIVLATKVGERPDLGGLAPATIRAAIDGSLSRLQTDYVDLYYAHFDDQSVPLEETLSAFDEVVRAGKVRYIGASKYSAARLREALDIQSRAGLAPYVALSSQYNLASRDLYEGELEQLCAEAGVAAVPYYGLASGFLTGKYRGGSVAPDASRAQYVQRFMTPHGQAILPVLADVAARRGASQAAVALAWLSARPTVVAPIASARSLEQLSEITAALTLELDEADMAMLDSISAPAR